MLETPHVLVGAAIALKVQNPILSIPLAFASHFVLELVPHWNPHINTEIKKYGSITKKSYKLIIFDSFLALISGTLLGIQFTDNYLSLIYFLLACFASVLPDVIEAPYFVFGIKNKLLDKWIKFQKVIQNDVDVLPGILTQIIVAMAAVWWIIQ